MALCRAGSLRFPQLARPRAGRGDSTGRGLGPASLPHEDLYDRGANITQVVEPLNRLIEDTEHGMHFGDHVGDWLVVLCSQLVCTIN